MPNYSKIKRLTEYLLGILALIGIFLFLQLSMNQELSDPDIWLHLKTGEYIIQHKAIPQIDSYSVLASGKPWIDHSVLSQVIFYLAFSLGGSDGLIFLSAILMLLAFLLLFFCIYKNNSTASLAIAMLALTVFASRTRFNIRPENFSVLFFCAFLLILAKFKNKIWIFLLPLIQIIWVNCHGFFILGPLIIALFVVAEKLEKKKYRNLAIVFLLSVFALLINPYGIKGVLYPLTIISGAISKSTFAYNKIVELFPVWRLSLDQIAPYYALLIISAGSFLLNFRKTNLAYLFGWLVFLGVSFNINRNIIFFNCFACFVTTDNFSRIDYRKIFPKLLPDNFIFLLKCIVLTLIITSSVIYCTKMLNNAYYILGQYRTKSSLLGEAAGIYPAKAADFILKHKLPDNLFNNFNNGSYLIYRLYPQNHIFIDGRTELYNDESFKDYYRIRYADKITIAELLTKYNINTVFISGREILDEEKLVKYLNQNKEWVLVYLNEDGLIFMRLTIKNKDLAKQLRVDLDKWETNKADLRKIGLLRVSAVSYTRLAQMLYALGADQKAQLQAKEALNLLPTAGDAYNILGRIYLDKGNLDQAYLYLRLASLYGADEISTTLALNNYYMKTGDSKNPEKAYKKIIKTNPRYADAYYYLGMYYSGLGDLKNALKYLRKACQLAPYLTEYLDEFNKVSAKIKNI